MQENMGILESIPKSLKLNVGLKEAFEIYKTHQTNPAEILNDQTSFQANTIFESTIQSKTIICENK